MKCQQAVTNRVVLHRCVLRETIGLQCRALLSSPVVLLVKIDVHVMLERLVSAVMTVNVLVFQPDNVKLVEDVFRAVSTTRHHIAGFSLSLSYIYKIWCKGTTFWADEKIYLSVYAVMRVCVGCHGKIRVRHFPVSFLFVVIVVVYDDKSFVRLATNILCKVYNFFFAYLLFFAILFKNYS